MVGIHDQRYYGKIAFDRLHLSFNRKYNIRGGSNDRRLLTIIFFHGDHKLYLFPSRKGQICHRTENVSEIPSRHIKKYDK